MSLQFQLYGVVALLVVIAVAGYFIANRKKKSK